MDQLFFEILYGNSHKVLVILIATGDRMFKDGRIRRDPTQTVLRDQTAQLAAADQVAPDVVEPDGLAEGVKFK